MTRLAIYVVKHSCMKRDLSSAATKMKGLNFFLVFQLVLAKINVYENLRVCQIIFRFSDSGVLHYNVSCVF